MKFLKPYKGVYILVLGNGRIIRFDEDELKVMSMAYDEMRLVPEQSRRMFSMNSQPIDKLMEGIKERRKCREDYE